MVLTVILGVLSLASLVGIIIGVRGLYVAQGRPDVLLNSVNTLGIFSVLLMVTGTTFVFLVIGL